MCISSWLQTELGITFCKGQGWGEGGGNRYICISLDVYYYLYSSVFIRYIYLWFVVQCLVIVATTPAGSGSRGFILTWTVYKQLTPGFIILTGVDPGVHSSVGVCVSECVVV